MFSDDHKLFALLVPTKRRIAEPLDDGKRRTVHKISIVELVVKEDGTPDPSSLIRSI